MSLGGVPRLSVYMKSKQATVEAHAGSYEDIASEYYDRIRHPTCANFREASAGILKTWLQKHAVERGQVCEVGAGNSLLAELLVDAGENPHGVIISDPSPSMLAFSNKWINRGAELSLNSAEMIPVASNSLGLVVSSLGDAYNQPTFWEEINRCLRPGGMLFFTTPAYEWAKAFRSKNGEDDMMAAEFQLKDGRRVFVPSWIYPVEKQVELIKNSGLEIWKVVHVPRSTLESEPLSPKLFVGHGDKLHIVTGYLCTKSRISV
jgi:SAM-dependent methyltransferase